MTMRSCLRTGYDIFGTAADAVFSIDFVFDELYLHRGIDSNPFRTDTPEALGYFDAYNNKMASWQASKLKKKTADIPEVKVVKRPSKRRISQPIFKMKFDTKHDIDMRLRNSMIWVGSEPYMVSEIYQDGKDFVLLITDKESKKWKVPYYACPDIDLRSPEPQYFIYRHRPAFLMRQQGRYQIQGYSHNNSHCAWVGKKDDTFHVDDGVEFMRGLATDPCSWNGAYYQLMVKNSQIPALRLSKDLAVYVDRNNALYAEYKGRKLGAVNEDTISVDEDDYSRPWIRRAANDVGLSVRV